jgi:hypothetical protein
MKHSDQSRLRGFLINLPVDASAKHTSLYKLKNKMRMRIMKNIHKINNRVTVMLFFCGIGLLVACSSTTGVAVAQTADTRQKGEVMTSGIIQKPESTTYQYGTHVLQDQDGKILYALKSTSVQLDNYIGKKVDLQGKFVEDYPVDGGPPFVEVVKIIE